MIKGELYGKSTDLWSLGVLLYDMLVGHPPFQAKSRYELQKKIVSSKLKYPTFLSSSCVNLLKGLMERNVTKRLTIEKVKQHVWFRSIDWNRVLAKEIEPPIRPHIQCGPWDVSNFDEELTTQSPRDSPPSRRVKLSKNQQLFFRHFTYVRMSPPSSEVSSHRQRCTEDGEICSETTR